MSPQSLSAHRWGFGEIIGSQVYDTHGGLVTKDFIAKCDLEIEDSLEEKAYYELRLALNLLYSPGWPGVSVLPSQEA